MTVAKPEPVVCGIDPGLAKCGWCLLTGEKLAAAAVIRTKKADGPEEARIHAITDALREIIATHPEEVTLLAVETQHAQGGDPATMRARAAATNSVAAVRGAVVTVAHYLGIPVREVSPQEGKRALTGSGKADKQAMVKFARARFGEKLATDAADACGIALSALQVVAGRTPARKQAHQQKPREEAVSGWPAHVQDAIKRGRQLK